MGVSARSRGIKRQQTLEKAKAYRREAILKACERLIRKYSSTDFSMRELASEAGISTYTTYNLIGSKSTVLYILLNSGIDKIVQASGTNVGVGDPIDCVFNAGDAVANVFSNDATFYRPLMRYLFGVLDPVHRPIYMERAFKYWNSAVESICQDCILSDNLSPRLLARNLQVYFTGAIDYWVHGEINGEELRAQVRHGIAIHLLALLPNQFAGRLTAELKATAPIIERMALRS